jgi:hypothetical protein
VSRQCAFVPSFHWKTFHVGTIALAIDLATLRDMVLFHISYIITFISIFPGHAVEEVVGPELVPTNTTKTAAYAAVAP